MKHKMANIIRWLHHRTSINILLVVFFFLLVVLPHEQVGLLVVHIFKGYNRDAYNFTLLIVGLVGLAAYIVPTIKNLYKGEDKSLKIFYFLMTLLFVVISFNLLVIINVEIIHFLQYGLMAILLFPLTQRYGETLFWATLLGAIDEAYQYFYLAPHRTEYYDFNDVVINLLGGAMGLMYLRSMDLGKIGIPRQKWLKTAPFVISCMMAIIIVILWKVGILFVYPPAEGVEAIILLVKTVPPGFWSVIHPNVTYHVIEPLEGVILVLMLLLFYSGLHKHKLTFR